MPKSLPDPTEQEWKALYHAAMEFESLKCWNHFWETDLFGVRNPETGEIGYCCIMGREGEHLALAVYRGTLGLEGLATVLNGDVNRRSLDVLHTQNCIMASFENRHYLDERDLAVIKNLQLEFRGPNSWPLFRDYTPGFVPWFLNGKDARFLTLALGEAAKMLERIKKDPALLTPKPEYKLLVRVRSDMGGSWSDEWLEPIYEKGGFESLSVPSIRKRLDTILKAGKPRSGTLEVGTYFVPTPVRDGMDRPYFSKLVLYVDKHSCLILSFFMSKPLKYQKNFIDNFTSFLEKSPSLPKEFIASDYEILELLKPVADKLGIVLFASKFLEATDIARKNMYDFIERNPNAHKKRKIRRR